MDGSAIENDDEKNASVLLLELDTILGAVGAGVGIGVGCGVFSASWSISMGVVPSVEYSFKPGPIIPSEYMFLSSGTCDDAEDIVEYAVSSELDSELLAV